MAKECPSYFTLQLCWLALLTPVTELIKIQRVRSVAAWLQRELFWVKNNEVDDKDRAPPLTIDCFLSVSITASSSEKASAYRITTDRLKWGQVPSGFHLR
ncbi:hypothetical protein GCM10011328_18200 [Hafnia psychrotolerans]|uniref:Secreted protein n=1 Tax=Hafnia psychrotolerans TaxID=1477018 RepID=A0ABQ1GH23_9GAMM|nr:hypothetical protein GCM10011328_18200 [Hafnia psychrotolerans]